MTNKATFSNRPVPNQDSSPRSEGSSPSAPEASQAESFRRPGSLDLLEARLPELRNEDFASWGAYVYEDLGVIDLDRAVGGASSFGAAIRAELVHENRFKPKWVRIASRLHRMSPATENPAEMMAGLCILAAAHLLVTSGG